MKLASLLFSVTLCYNSYVYIVAEQEGMKSRNAECTNPYLLPMQPVSSKLLLPLLQLLSRSSQLPSTLLW